MSLESIAGQVLIAGFPAGSAPTPIREAIAQGGLGGIILFRRNVDAGPRATLEFLADLIGHAAEPILIAVDQEGGRVARLRDNVAYARKKIKDVGFEVIESPTAICPVIVGETAKAIEMSHMLLELWGYVIGFGYPVVPEGTARLRCQISAAHTREHIDELAGALARL